MKIVIWLSTAETNFSAILGSYYTEFDILAVMVQVCGKNFIDIFGR
jgi:hypothetical protein